MLFKIPRKFDKMTDIELKSLKNPTRILTIIMFLSFTIYSMGTEGLSQALPGLPTWVLTFLVGAATWAVTQYGTEKRIVRAEELKDQEYQQDIIEEEAEDGI